MFDRILNTSLEIFFFKTRNGTTMNRIAGYLPTFILYFNFVPYRSHSPTPSPYISVFRKGISQSNQRSNSSCMSEHTTNLDKTLAEKWSRTVSLSLRKKCPYTELFWSAFSPNAVKYGPE